MHKVILLILNLIFITSCSLLKRHPRSGYAFNEESYSTSFDKDFNDRELEKIQISLGYDKKQELTYADLDRIKTRYVLDSMIKELSPRDYNQYIRYHHALMSDQEKINFLQINNYDAKENWAIKNNLREPLKRMPASTKQLINTSDIAIGMHKEAVLQSWGKPKEVLYAGNKNLQNEKWIYEKTFVENEQFVTQTRYIIFESGRVAGWETQK